MPTVAAVKDEEFLDSAQLAQRWGMEVGTLENWRSARPRKGPPYVKLGGKSGRVMYRLRDVIAFEQDNTIQPGKAPEEAKS